MSKIIMSARNLTKNYGRIKALDNVSFDIPEGVAALIGPNGSGKTTLINIILGLLKPDAGEITVLGFDPWRNGHLVRRFVNVLHEKPSFPKWFTGLEYLLYAAELYGIPNPGDKVYEVASQLNIVKELDKRIGEYSAGMVQRLGLAQVMLSEPKLIILDEPTANLDPSGRIEVLNLIKTLRNTKGISFILSSHVLSELERVCDFIVFLHYGHLLLASDVKNLMPFYSNLEYKIVTNDNRLLFDKARNAGFENVELLEDGVIFKAEDSGRMTEILQFVFNSGLKVEYIEPERRILENIYISILEKQK